MDLNSNPPNKFEERIFYEYKFTGCYHCYKLLLGIIVDNFL